MFSPLTQSSFEVFGVAADIADIPNGHVRMFIYYLEEIAERNVLFVLLPEPFYSYNISEYPFIFVPLFEKALAVAEVKRSDFMKFAETLEKQPQPKTYFSRTQLAVVVTLLGEMLHR
ncbi:unnamed protein product [Cylicocyclus nassatus]|uniref:Uncharacterized protein n=1 Tax=Cylicocyclus nassatus TaxID=53992 RepID=A0AA36GXA6_CYLNA|nr:unnamed protein product [Cylicocyclus nassatus]